MYIGILCCCWAPSLSSTPLKMNDNLSPPFPSVAGQQSASAALPRTLQEFCKLLSKVSTPPEIPAKLSQVQIPLSSCLSFLSPHSKSNPTPAHSFPSQSHMTPTYDHSFILCNNVDSLLITESWPSRESILLKILFICTSVRHQACEVVLLHHKDNIKRRLTILRCFSIKKQSVMTYRLCCCCYSPLMFRKCWCFIPVCNKTDVFSGKLNCCCVPLRTWSVVWVKLYSMIVNWQFRLCSV